MQLIWHRKRPVSLVSLGYTPVTYTGRSLRRYIRSFWNVSILTFEFYWNVRKIGRKYIEKSDWYILHPVIDMPKRSTYHMHMEGGLSVIIDSHAHYNNNAYKKPFRYLSYDKYGYALKEGDRDNYFRNCWMPISHAQLNPGSAWNLVKKFWNWLSSIQGGSFRQLAFILPDPFLKNGRIGINWLNMRIHLAWSLSAKSVWTIITSARSSTDWSSICGSFTSWI